MKAYEIPISKAAHKMLKRDFGYQNHMRIDGVHHGKSRTNLSVVKNYLATTKAHQVRITLVGRYASEARLYTIALLIESTFNQRMLTYVEGAVEAGMPAAEALQRFFDKYDLSEDDMLESSAYKRWQRHLNREKQREFIPLW